MAGRAQWWRGATVAGRGRKRPGGPRPFEGPAGVVAPHSRPRELTAGGGCADGLAPPVLGATSRGGGGEGNKRDKLGMEGIAPRICTWRMM